jgi:hypothetical protein
MNETKRRPWATGIVMVYAAQGPSSGGRACELEPPDIGQDGKMTLQVHGRGHLPQFLHKPRYTSPAANIVIAL